MDGRSGRMCCEIQMSWMPGSTMGRCTLSSAGNKEKGERSSYLMNIELKEKLINALQHYDDF